MLGDLQDQRLALMVDMERVQDRRQVALELHVDDGAHHLRDPAHDVLFRHILLLAISRRSAGPA